MPIANINKIYYGDTEITKVMYGETVVYESTPPINWEYELYDHDVTNGQDATCVKTTNPFYYNDRPCVISYEFTNLYRDNGGDSGHSGILANGLRSYTGGAWAGGWGIVRKPNTTNYSLFLYNNNPVIFDDETENLFPDAPVGTDTNTYRIELKRVMLDESNAKITLNVFVNNELYKSLERTFIKVNAPSNDLIIGGTYSLFQNRPIAEATIHINHFKIGYLD